MFTSIVLHAAAGIVLSFAAMSLGVNLIGIWFAAGMYLVGLIRGITL